MIKTLIEFLSMGDNYGILASEHMLTRMFKDSSIFFFFGKVSMVALRIFFRLVVKKLRLNKIK